MVPSRFSPKNINACCAFLRSIWVISAIYFGVKQLLRCSCSISFFEASRPFCPKIFSPLLSRYCWANDAPSLTILVFRSYISLAINMASDGLYSLLRSVWLGCDDIPIVGGYHLQNWLSFVLAYTACHSFWVPAVRLVWFLKAIFL